MRRGLLAWSKEEVPESVLDSRVERCRAAMQNVGLGALVLYTNFPRPAAVSYLTHFVPYWNQGLVVVLPDAAPILLIALSKRVAGWIAETGHFGEIVSTPRVAQELVKLLDTRAPAARIGIVELDKVPMPLLRALSQAERGYALEDATALFESVRHPADDAEIALSRKAARIARVAFAEIDPSAADGAVVAALERRARLAGAEEALIDIAADLDAAPAFRRLDGPVAFADRYAVRLSIAYKGHWIRYARSFAKGKTERAREEPVEDVLESVAQAIRDGSGPVPSSLAGTTIREMVIEGCRGGTPLARLGRPSAGGVVSVGVALDLDGRRVLAAEPMLLAASPSKTAKRLTG